MCKSILPTYLTLLTVLTFLSTSLQAQHTDEQQIRDLLTRQAKDWNKGDIEAFMHGYWENDSLVFVGKSGPKYGYHTALENYKKSYPDTTAMGKLSFDFLKLERISPSCFFLLGRWHLQRTIGNLEGYYTLILKKKNGKWVIVADHSS